LRSYLESTHYKKKKKVGRVVQVVDHLPSKREALNSNPQKKKKIYKASQRKKLTNDQISDGTGFLSNYTGSEKIVLPA
jgi:hypothetical protein